MKIHELIPLETIKEAKSILLGHLYQLIKMDKDEREMFLKVFKNLEQNQYIRDSKIELKQYYRVDHISTIAALKKQNESYYNTPEKIEKYLLEQCIIPQYKQKFNEKLNYDSTGIALKSNLFNLEKYYENEPIDEQSLVGLFCTMFHMIANENFKFKYAKKTISFSKIMWIREKFPDARLKFNEYDSKGNHTGYIELFIEFEYKSNNYIKHLHHITPKRDAQMIICWEDNWGDTKPYACILSIKQLLETGEIKLHSFGA